MYLDLCALSWCLFIGYVWSQCVCFDIVRSITVFNPLPLSVLSLEGALFVRSYYVSSLWISIDAYGRGYCDKKCKTSHTHLSWCRLTFSSDSSDENTEGPHPASSSWLLWECRSVIASNGNGSSSWQCLLGRDRGENYLPVLQGWGEWQEPNTKEQG